MIAGVAAFAQVTSSSLEGIVSDESGEALPGAVVSAVHTPSGTQYYAVANDKGQYHINGMRAGGPYTVEISFIGTATQQTENITLKLGETYILDASLKATNELDAVVVVSESSFNASKTGAGASFSLRQVEHMPTINRSVFDVVKYTPQASSSKYGGISIAGASSRYNSFQIDGAVANDSFGLSSDGTNGAMVSANPIALDAIEEIQVVVAPFDVRQSGFTGGAINAITKSGTNTVKGTAYAHYYNQNFIGTTPGTTNLDDPLALSSLKKDANGNGVRTKYDEELTETFGATVGAPIIKNKLFIFVSAEYHKTSTPNIYSPVNDSYEDSARLLKNNITYNGKDLGNVFNTTVAQAAIDHYKAYFAKGLDITEDYQPMQTKKNSLNALARIDWNINPDNKLMVRYQLLDASSASNSSGNRTYYFNNSNNTIVNRTHTIVGELNSRLGDNLTNELRATAVLVNEHREVPYVAPTIYTSGDNTVLDLGTHYCSYINKTLTNTYTLTDNLQWSLGAHNLTFGTHNEFYTFANAYRTYATGQYNFASVSDFFDTTTTAEKASAFLYNYADPTVEGVTGPDWYAQTQALQLGVYVQDEWKPNRNFTLTYGIRGDVPMLLNKPSENKDFNANISKYSTDSSEQVGVTPKVQMLWSPRVGFRLFLNDDHSSLLRGGAGLFTGRVPFVWLSNAYNNTGVETKSINITDKEILAAIPVTTDPYNDIVLGNKFTNPKTGQKGIQGSSAGATINTLSSNFKYPQVLRVNLGFDQEFAGGWKLTLDALYSKNFNAIYFRNVALQQSGVTYGASAAAAASNPSSVMPYYQPKSTDYKTIVALGSTDAGYSYSASVKIEKTFTWGLDLMASYTYGHSFSANDGLSSQALSNLSTMKAVDINNPEVSWSLYDIPHKVNAVVSYTTPMYLGRLRSSISLTYTGTSGQRYSYTVRESSTSEDMNGDGTTGNSLMYIPTFEELAGMSWASPADAAKFENAIRSDKYLRTHRGMWSQRNAGTTAFEHHFDLQFAQDIFYDVKNMRKVQLTLDVLNISNMFNREWGLYYASTIYRTLLSCDSLSKDASGNMVPTYSFYDDNAIYLSDFYSRWRCQLGVKITF